MTKVTFYANIYARSLIGSRGGVYDSQKTADEMANPSRIACVPFTVELPGNEEGSDADAGQPG